MHVSVRVRVVCAYVCMFVYVYVFVFVYLRVHECMRAAVHAYAVSTPSFLLNTTIMFYILQHLRNLVYTQY